MEIIELYPQVIVSNSLVYKNEYYLGAFLCARIISVLLGGSMKKYKVEIISAMLTMIFLSLVYIGFVYFFGVKDSYQISSEIGFSNSKGKIDGYHINYDDFINDDGNFQMKLKVGSEEKREIDFEISALVNYRQQNFKTKDSVNNVLSKVISIKENKKEVVIILDKSNFEFYQNHLVINIRQDIKELSYQNKLVRNSKTLNFTFYVKNKNGRNEEYFIGSDNYKNMIEIPLEDETQNVVFDINAANNDQALITTKKNEKIPINLGLGGNKTREYIIWASLDSKQVKIDGQPFNKFRVNKNMIGFTNLEIENPVQPGIYELEIYCVPSPEEMGKGLKEIISGKRYTIKVE